MNKRLICGLFLGMVAASGTAMAGDVSSARNYTFVEAGYVKADPNNTSIDADGGYLRGSYGFQNGLYVAGKAQRLKVDNTNFHVNDYDLGLGYHHALGNRVDGFAEVAAIRAEAAGLHADGYRVGAGVKVDVTNKLEGLVQVNYRDGRDYTGDTSGVVGARYSFTPNWSAAGGVEFVDGGKAYNVGVRYSF